MEERYKVGDKIKLNYIKFEKPQTIETILTNVSSQCPWGIELPLGAQIGAEKYVAYYLLTDFKEVMRIEGDELIVER